MSFDIKRARVNAGHSLRSLAREVGIAQATLERLEAGEVVHPASAKKVADHFEVQVTDIMPLEPAGEAA